MLVLSRKVGEKLVIDGNITVVINRIVGNRITLGIEAPEHVHIVRGELHDKQDRDQPVGPPCLATPVSMSQVPQLFSLKSGG